MKVKEYITPFMKVIACPECPFVVLPTELCFIDVCPVCGSELNWKVGQFEVHIEKFLFSSKKSYKFIPRKEIK